VRVVGRGSKGALQCFAGEIGVRARHRLALQAEPRHGRERQQFPLFYPPRVRLADGALVGLEAFVRWCRSRDVDLRLSFNLSPMQFLGRDPVKQGDGAVMR
jgi:sensor c-di-GMP phosphodiesterase-like protein